MKKTVILTHSPVEHNYGLLHPNDVVRRSKFVAIEESMTEKELESVASTGESDLAVTIAITRYLDGKGEIGTWTVLSTIEAGLAVDLATLQRAVVAGIDRGWLISNGNPGNAVCLTAIGAMASKT